MDGFVEKSCGDTKDSLCKWFNADKVFVKGEYCDGIWEIKDEIGKGGFGTVSDACCKGSCKYAIKEITGRFVEYYFLEEVKLQQMAAKVKVAPNIYQVWIGKETGAFVMDGLRITAISKILKEFPNKRAVSKIINECFSILEELHKIGIVHKDAHLSNFMYDILDRPFLIDYGLASLSDYFWSDYRMLYDEVSIGLFEYLRKRGLLTEDNNHIVVELTEELAEKIKGKGYVIIDGSVTKKLDFIPLL